MGVVTPFIPREETGGWTEAERDRLSDLADRLSAKFGRVHATFGTSDQGEPWCVITDDDDEVIVHVARINGQFVIHEAGDDTLRVGETLWSACDRLLGDDWRDDRDDVVVSLSRRQAQSVLAIAVLADFVYELGDADAAPAPEPPTAFKAALPAASVLSLAPAAIAIAAAHDTPPPPPPEGPDHGQLLAPEDRTAEVAQDGARLNGDDRLQPTEGDVEDAPPPAPLATVEPDGEAQPAGRTLVGGDGNDRLEGGDGRDMLIGGAGDDTATGGGADDTLVGGENNDVLRGDDGDDIVYGNGGSDTVDGGEGNDWVRGGQGDDSVGGGAGDDFVSGDKGNDTLSGGPGADTFNFLAGGGHDVVTDFDRRHGDKVVIEDHSHYTVAQEGADTVVSLNAVDRVVLLNTQVSTLSEGWIVG